MVRFGMVARGEVFNVREVKEEKQIKHFQSRVAARQLQLTDGQPVLGRKATRAAADR
jgi:hypothetical protein